MKIKLGDKIYFFQYGKYPIAREEIIKITPTMLRTKNYNLKINGDYLSIKGRSKWSNTTAQLENDLNKSLWKEAKIIYWFSNKKFSADEKIKIFNFLNSLKTE